MITGAETGFIGRLLLFQQPIFLMILVLQGGQICSVFTEPFALGSSVNADAVQRQTCQDRAERPFPRSDRRDTHASSSIQMRRSGQLQIPEFELRPFFKIVRQESDLKGCRSNLSREDGPRLKALVFASSGVR